ncbi:MAG: hypothetical protein SCARUB_02432 [Candidatus Scalindua rubra]|uniref:Uncharacterized protein n=1 Tax=Candidatus Scalindua rubra TaxID=1872076 RepID=A0A1E3XBV9_9BACT|nr:MAG: hypothetical protein SCARUB_02432 [Candidatus Scalindua rubra]
MTIHYDLIVIPEETANMVSKQGIYFRIKLHSFIFLKMKGVPFYSITEPYGTGIFKYLESE